MKLIKYFLQKQKPQMIAGVVMAIYFITRFFY